MSAARRGVAAGGAALLAAVALSPGPAAGRTAYDGHRKHKGFDKLETLDGTVRRTRSLVYDGPVALLARVRGRGNAFGRGVFRLRWEPGDDVWFGAAFRLGRGFYRDQEGQVDLLRWDNYPLDPSGNDRSGVVIFGSDHRARLVRERLGVEEVAITRAFDLPERRWFWLEVHQVLADDGTARNEVFVDGRRVASSRLVNSYGRPVRRVRYGIVAVDQARQRRPLRLWFDRATAGRMAAGPLPRGGR